MNKTDQQNNNTYINYWKESGTSSRNTNNEMKISVTSKYIDKNGNERTRTTFRHPKLSDLTFSKGKAISKGLTPEEKKTRLDEAPYSEEHKQLIAGLYSKENRILKQQAFIGAHNEKIQNLMFKRSMHKLHTKQYNNRDCPNLLIIKRLDSKGLPYDFSINPSRKSLDELWKEAKAMSSTLTKTMRDFFSIEIWEKSEYISKVQGKLANYRYCTYKDKGTVNQAA